MTPLFSVLYIIGITAEAMTAALSAGRQKLDLFGVTLLAAITALGGGTVRDMVLDDYPLTWVGQPKYLVFVLVAALITVWMSFLMHYFRHLFLILDALGLAVFSVLGTQVALNLGHGFVIASVAAIISGVFGGILRDLLSDRVPLVFSGEFYASISLAATAVYMLLLEAGLSVEITAIATVIFGFCARLWAIYSKRGLPVFEYKGAEQPIDPRLRLSARLVRDGARSMKRRAGSLASGRNLRFDASAYTSVNRQTGKHARGNRDRDPQQQWVIQRPRKAAQPTRHAKPDPKRQAAPGKNAAPKKPKPKAKWPRLPKGGLPRRSRPDEGQWEQND